jgi:hypothetical protein
MARDRAKVSDVNRVRLAVAQPADAPWVLGSFRAWTTRNGLPVAAMRRRDGSRAYEVRGANILLDEMRNIVRNYIFRLTGGTGEAAELFTAGPYIGLATNTPTGSATLASGITEAVGNGYSRYNTAWTAGATGQANNTAAAATWTASGGNLGGGALASLFTTHAASGTGSTPNDRAISAMALNGGPYTIASGNTLNVTYTWTLNAS